MKMAKPKSSGLRLVLMAAAVVALFVLGWVLPLREWIDALRTEIAALGFWGPLLFTAGYAVAAALMVPGSLLTIASGVMFGLAEGFLVAWLGATLGAMLAFSTARHVARRPLSSVIERHPRFEAVDRAIEELGYKVVLLMRLSPLIPFNLQNYLFGLTEIRFWHYSIATLVGMVPGVLLYTYVGSAGADASEGQSASRWIFAGVGLAATAVATWIVGRRAKQKLEELGVEAKPRRRRKLRYAS